MIAVMMTACDLISMSHHWDISHKQIIGLHDEFYNEGDQRKQLGLPCIPMMDRERRDDLCQGQIDFFNFVVLKCYETTSRVLPESEPILVGVRANRDLWVEEKAKLDRQIVQEEMAAEAERARVRKLEAAGNKLISTQHGDDWQQESSTE